MIPRIQQSIYSLQSISHRINFWELQKTYRVRLQATGKLAGEFYESKGIVLEQKITFIGNFHGFFEEVECERGTLCYFEGKIQNFVVLQTDAPFDSPLGTSDVIDKIGENMFVGYFSGFIEEADAYSRYGVRQCLLRQLIDRNWLSVQSSLKLILPTFSRLQLKSITAINLQKSLATFSGTIVISIQFSYQLLELFYHPANRERRIAIDLNKDLSIELPLIPGNYADENNDVSCSINKNFVMEYKIRRTFNASIDDHYGQFFTPFSLSHANLVLSFQQLKLANPRRPKPSSFDRLRCVQTAHLEEVLIDFLNLDLDDCIDGNPYTPYNELLKIENAAQRKQMLLKRTTKISFSERLESGQYYIATNHLSLFTYHSLTFSNSYAINENDCWFLGLTDKGENIKEPQVLSIPEEYERGRELLRQGGRRVSKLFHVSLWKHVHISIPIYKYWVLNLIQIFIPILILDALSLFIFRQENGKKQDGTSTLNARIINVASILLAYTALIPLIKQRAPRATKSSFIYIVIYLSILPHLLVLISGIEYQHTSNADFTASYMPFKDICFFISFVFTSIIIFLVLLVVARYIYASSAQYQIKKNFSSNKFVSFRNSAFPMGAGNYVRSLYLKRPNQFVFQEVYDIETKEPRKSTFTSYSRM